jgi:nitrite reductase/ring-hydroxylating ferredoxin subunit
MHGSRTSSRKDRHPAESYEEILERETRPIPPYLREGRVPDIGVDPVAANRYFDRDFFELEAKYVWSRTWQMACREEDIPNVGDYHIYDILGKSLIVTRTSEGVIKAFFNSCLHRGRKLVTLNGCKNEFKCPYHGFTWNIDGTFKENPIGWDFPQWAEQSVSLPEARVATWGGFVFVNFDPSAKPLEYFIQPMMDDFERFDFPNRYRAAWVQKKLRCNWKATSEAFMEAHHSLTTHPQILPGIADANSQYDLPNDYVWRQFSATGVASPFLPPMTEKQIFEYMTGSGRGGGRRAQLASMPDLPDGAYARGFMAELSRQALAKETGYDYSHATDAEMLDAILYNVFPNMSFWAGYSSNIVYRWRPNGLDTDSAIMDVMILKPCPKDKPRPKPAPVLKLGLDDSMTAASEQLGEGLCAVFEQDMGNLPYVQEGLRATGAGVVHFGKYSEIRIRQLHRMIDRFIAEGIAASTATNM